MSTADRGPRSRTRLPLTSVIALAVAVQVVAAVAALTSHTSPGSAMHDAAMNDTAANSAHMEMATDASFVADAPPLVPEGWAVQASSALPGHLAAAVIDGRASTYWQSARSTTPSITLDLRSAQAIAGLSYAPRTMTPATGVIGRFTIQVSQNGVSWGAPVSTGTWSDTPGTKTVGFAAVTARYLRLTAVTGSAPISVTASTITLLGPLRSSVAAVNTASDTSPSLDTNPAQVGQWGATYGFPFVPAAAALLPGNQLLVWAADQDLGYSADNASNITQTAILNLNTGLVSPETITNTDHNMFCPGVAILADGDIMVTGGDSDDKTSIYDSHTNAWTAGPPMNIGRGYQGMTLLSTEQAFTLGGSWSGPDVEKDGEVWSPTGGWRLLPDVPAWPMYTQDPQGVFRQDNHGWFIATSGGRVLQAGPSKQMNWITTSGAGSITPAGNRSTADQMNGDAVYYTTNKVLTLGGAPDYQDSYATKASYTIDLSGSTPVVKRVGNLNDARSFANSVVLPTGQVLVMGGEGYAVPFSDDTSVLNAEMWDPSTGRYTLMAPEAEPRNYHSVAILLPDGQVFSGGGGLCGSCDTNHTDGQIYSPPYLFNADGTPATRPTITAAPTTAGTGQTIRVTTAAPVSSFSMVRDSESTHSVDNDQRRLPLTIRSHVGSTYTVAIPSDPGVALPGPWMLFAITKGVPSVSTPLMITTPAAPGPTDAYGRATLTAGPGIYWPLADSAGTIATDLSGNTDTGDYSAAGVSFGTASPVEGSAGRGVRLNGAQGQIVSAQMQTDPTTYSEEMWFRTTTTTGGSLMSFGNAASGLSLQDDRQVYMTDTGTVVFGVNAGANVVISAPHSSNDGAWHQVVATQGPDGMSLYIDGQLVASSPTSGDANFAGYWHVGGDTLTGWPDAPTSNYLAATVSDIAFFNTELTGAQVSSQYAAAG